MATLQYVRRLPRSPQHRHRPATVRSVPAECMCGTAAQSSLVFEGHTVTLVEVDGHYVEPTDLNFLDAWNGQTFSVLLTAK